MSEQPPQEPKQEPTHEPKKKSKGLPTWIWFVGTFVIVSLLGNVVFGGNTWIQAGQNFVSTTFASVFSERVPATDRFCASDAVSEFDRENSLSLAAEAITLVDTTTGAIGFASMSEDPQQLAEAINIIQNSGSGYIGIGERLLTAQGCSDPTFEYLVRDLGSTLVEMGENFDQWNAETLITNPELLLSVAPLVEAAQTKAGAVKSYVEKLN